MPRSKLLLWAGFSLLLVIAVLFVLLSPPPPPPEQLDSAASFSIDEDAPPTKLNVTSPAFSANGEFPKEFTCDGAGISPPIEWTGSPEGTKSHALSIWHIPPDGGIKSYWVVYDIPPDVFKLPKNALGIGQVGLNDRRRAEYDPMCSRGPGAKRYHVTVHALSDRLKPDARGLNRAEMLTALKPIELARGTLTYVYTR